MPRPASHASRPALLLMCVHAPQRAQSVSSSSSVCSDCDAHAARLGLGFEFGFGFGFGSGTGFGPGGLGFGCLRCPRQKVAHGVQREQRHT